MNNINIKKWISVLLAVLIVLIALVFAGKKFLNKREKQAEKQLLEPKQVVKQPLSPKEVPNNIPVNLPQEEGAVLEQNYNVKTLDNQEQGTRVYETTKTLAEAYAEYQNYFAKNGWKVSAVLDTQSVKSVTAEKDKIRLQVSITENSVSKARKVIVNANPIK